MATRIFLSNKDTWGNDIETAINEAKEAFAADESYCGTWTCGNVRAIQIGDKAYFKRVGSEPRGFFARGRIVAAKKEGSIGIPGRWNRETPVAKIPATKSPLA